MGLQIDLRRISLKITEEQDAAAFYFAENYDYSEYKDRGQNNLANMKRQNYEGKKVEFAVYNWFKAKGWEISEVDITLYPKGQKSFAQDLIGNGQPLQIKSQSKSSAEMWGVSFIFQYKNIYGPGGRDKHAFDNPNSNDGVICGLVDGLDITIVLRTRIHVIHDQKLFKEPKKKEFIGIKKAIYLKHFEELIA